MSVSTRNLTLFAIGAAVVLGLGYVSFRTDPVPVDLVEVVRGPMQVTVNADGRTQVRDLYEIASPIAGTALRSPVDVGDPVTKDVTVVAVVQPGTPGLLDDRTRRQAEAELSEATASLHLAETELLRAEKEYSFYQTQFDRTKALAERGVATVTSLEDATQALEIAEAAVAAAQARIELAQGTIAKAEASLMVPDSSDTFQDSCCIRVKAPSDGVVLSVATISQRPVNPGTPLLTIGDPGELELVADILSSDGVRLIPGAPASVERWGGDGALEARLDHIEPAARTKVSALGIEEQRVDAYLSLVTPRDERPGLGDGFAVFLRIVEWQGDDVLQLPVSALFRVGEDWAVFVASDGTASRRIVQIGHRNNQSAEILGGIDEGERVIVHPSDQIADGVTIIERTEL